MIDVEKIKKELNELIQKISLQFDGLTNEEKKELLLISDRFNHTLVALTIFNDNIFKDSENEKNN